MAISLNNPPITFVNGELFGPPIPRFPVIPHSGQINGNAQTWQTRDEARVATYDLAARRPALSHATTFTFHVQELLVEIATRQKRLTRVTPDQLICHFDPIRCDITASPAKDLRGKALAFSNQIARWPERPVLQIPPFVFRHFNQGPRGREPVQPVSQIKCDIDFGRFIGALVSDAWGDGSAVNYAKIDDLLVQKFDEQLRRIAPGYLTPQKTTRTRHQDRNMGLDGTSVKTRFYSAMMSALVRHWVGHRAKNKHLPGFFVSLPVEALWGLFGGLLDGDGTVATTQSLERSVPRTICFFTTVSPRLADEICVLAAILGIRATITPPGKAFVISFALPDIYRLRANIDLLQSNKTAALKEMSAPRKDDRDLVPCPPTLVQLLQDLTKKSAIKESVTGLSALKNSRIVVQRPLASRYLDHLFAHYPTHPLLKKWKTIIENRTLFWDVCESVTAADTAATFKLESVEPHPIILRNGLLAQVDSLHVSQSPKRAGLSTPGNPTSAEDTQEQNP